MIKAKNLNIILKSSLYSFSDKSWEKKKNYKKAHKQYSGVMRGRTNTKYVE
jgi:hypothetical protein